jgi:hypothetical protein
MRALCLLIVTTAACAEMPPERERLLFDRDHFSIDAVDSDWDVGRRLGSVEMARDQATMVVRAVPLAKNSLVNRESADVFAATRMVLAALWQNLRP